MREPYLIVHYSDMVSTSRRKLSRCINDHYWSRSMLEFLFVAFDDDNFGGDEDDDEFDFDDDNFGGDEDDDEL